MKYKLTFALVASMTSTAFAEFKAPLPEFKNEKQLAEWRAEKASEAISQGYAADASAFYTGKPYLASSGGYAFKYRSYDPEVVRWTSEDPSGFPDGVNGHMYVPVPTCGFDPDGLKARRAFENGVHTISLLVYVYDSYGTNFTQGGTMAAWKSAVESAWTFTGRDAHNGENLTLNTNISFRIQNGGTLNEPGVFRQYDDRIIIDQNTNIVNMVYGHNKGIFHKDVSNKTIVHEVGHFMMGDDQYTESFANGVRTTTPYNTEALGNWTNSIMGDGKIQAIRLDANHILKSLGETVHIFG